MTIKKTCRNPGAARKRNPGSESSVQMALVKWIKENHPEVGEHIIKIDNEGTRSIIGHVIAVKQGLHVGASDVFIAWPCGHYHGCWIELKREKWRDSPSSHEHTQRQLKFIRKMQDVDYFAELCVGLEEAIAAVSRYLA